MNNNCENLTNLKCCFNCWIFVKVHKRALSLNSLKVSQINKHLMKSREHNGQKVVMKNNKDENNSLHVNKVIFKMWPEQIFWLSVIFHLYSKKNFIYLYTKYLLHVWYLNNQEPKIFPVNNQYMKVKTEAKIPFF